MLTKPSNVSTLRQLQTVATTQTAGLGVRRDYLSDTNTRHLQMSSDVNGWTNGKPTPAAGQIVEIMAQVTHTPFVPAGHDQVTAFSSYNGFFASTPGRGEAKITVIRAAAARC